MRTTHRQRGIGSWIFLGAPLVASVVAAIYSWVVFITTLNFQVFPSDKFMFYLVGTTALALFWTVLVLLRIIRSWPDRKATNRLCEQAVKLQRIIQHNNDLHCNVGYEVVPGDTYAATLHGQLVGLRIAICVLNGWPANTAADADGPAAQAIQRYREAHDPEHAPDPW